MEEFVISANNCLRHNTKAFTHSDYHGSGNWKIQGTVENMICTIKNHPDPYPQSVLNNATMRLSAILAEELPQILQATGLQNLRVCVIPRSKREDYFEDNQKLFRATIQQTIRTLNGFEDGIYDIIRHTNTATTHLSRSGRGGEGPMPYCGITKDTCTISNNVYGRDTSNDGKILTFALDRIVELFPSKNQDFENPPEYFDEHFDDIIGVTNYVENPILHIVFWISNFSKDYVLTKPLHGSQKKISGEGETKLREKYPSLSGGAFFSIDCKRNYELIRELSSFGQNLLVLLPKEIQDEIIKEISQMFEKYSKLKD